MVFTCVVGAAGSGVALRAVTVFTIVLGFARAGMRSAATWILPRLSAHHPSGIRGTPAMMFLMTAVSGIVCGIAAVALAPDFALTDDRYASDAARAASACQ